jgi:hypothetical protein
MGLGRAQESRKLVVLGLGHALEGLTKYSWAKGYERLKKTLSRKLPN